MPQTRDKSGRFVKGQPGNPGGRPQKSKQLHAFAQQAPQRLREIADAEDTPVKLKIEIEKWFYEVVFGKAAQALELEGGPIEVRALELEKLSDDQLTRLMEQADE